jgi:hypothetical protein
MSNHDLYTHISSAMNTRELPRESQFLQAASLGCDLATSRLERPHVAFEAKQRVYQFRVK